jgi:hypothetical protein
MLGAQLICPDLPKGLEKAAPLYLDITPWKDLSSDRPEFYNGKDAYATKHLDDAEEQNFDIQREEYAATLKLMPVLWRATERGLRVDKDAAVLWSAELATKLEKLVRTWRYPEVMLSSNKQLCNLLYNQLRLPRQFGKEGQLTVAEDALEELKVMAPEHEELLQHIVNFRGTARDLKVWGALPERVHPSYLPAVKEERGPQGHGSSTGRIQAREPNIMNLPREQRRLIIPDEGKFLGYCDWAQAEAWVEATLFNDASLKEALRGDLHAYISEKMGIDRVRAKNFWYGSGRGAGPRKLRKVMIAEGFRDCTEKQCKDFQASLRRMFPDWARGRTVRTIQAKMEKRCVNPFNRARFYFAEPGLPDVIGFLIQSTVASMFIRMLVEVDPYVEILAPYHDAVLFQSADMAQARKVVEIMQREYPEVAPGFLLRADLKTSTINWGMCE